MRAGQPACAAGAAARAQTAPVAAPALRLLRRSEPVRRRSLRATRASAAGGTNTELQICTNKTCRHQGSLNIADAARELAPPGVTVERTGCIGRCGSGPNLALLPSGLVISFCATPAQLAQLIERQCVGGQGTHAVLHALELRLQGNGAAARGDPAAAVELFTRALEAAPPRGKHLLLANRSAVRRDMDDGAGALADALAAQASDGPPDWTRGIVREAEARAALGDPPGAQAALARAAALDASVMKSSDVVALLERMQAPAGDDWLSE